MTDKSRDLDRFKRRLIRMVARMKEENVPNLWESVDKAMGKSCKNMWDLMRSLTLKKISRLLQCGDNLSRLSPPSRMTLTDWLLFDMVMVHEDIDTIHTQNNMAELPQLKALFELVVTHGLENCSKDTQAANWASAVMDYNAKGRQCSPMLLQRRWYELKRETRNKFYKFWEVFKRHSPSEKPGELYKEIAAKYPHIITTEEKSWSDLMKEGKIVLPFEFEKTVHMKEKTKPIENTSGSAEDIVLIEPRIETINLEDEMDDEISSLTTDNMENIDRQIACSETVNTTFDSFTVMSDENEVIEVKSDESPTIEEITEITSKISECEEDVITVDDPDETKESISIKEELNSEESLVFDPNSDDCQEEHENVIDVSSMYASTYANRACVDVPAKQFADKLIEDNVLERSRKERTDVVYPNLNEITANIKEEVYELSNEIVAPSTVLGDSKSLGTPVILKVETLHETEIDVIDVNTIPATPTKKAGPKSKTKFPPIKELTHDDYRKPGPKRFKNRDSSKLFHTLLNKPKELPEVIAEYEEGSFEFADEEVDIDVATLKSLQEQHVKAMAEHTTEPRLVYISDKVETEDNSNTTPSDAELASESEESSAQKFDLKLLMLPVVCTQKLNDMDILQNMDLNITIFGTEAIHAIEKLSKLKSPEKISVDETVDLNTTKESDVYDGECLNESMDFEEYIEESVNIVKETSSLFQKPKSRKYTPITLCKNPDFNTRLRRLSVAFLTSQRNRQLLKACKPLTIDLHKSFEEKLVNGIIKIKPPDKTDMVEINDFDHEKTTIAPSNMAAQSLIDNETVDIDELVEFSRMLRMRQKPIHLPDMDTQRIINKQLQIAQVTPLNQVSPVIRTTDTVPSPVMPAAPVMESSQDAVTPVTPQSIDDHNQRNVSKSEHIQDVKKPTESVLAQRKPIPSSSGVVRASVGGKSTTTNAGTKVSQDKAKYPPWRPLPKREIPAWTLPKYRFPNSELPFLLKEDSLARMLAALSPKEETNLTEGSNLKPLHSTKYCCTAKRHVVLNQARLRLLMTRASSDRERRRLSKELKIHQCKSFYDCSCCCRHILEVPDDNPKVINDTPSISPRDDEVATALAGLEPRKQQSPEEDYTSAVVMASAYTPPAVKSYPELVVVSPPLELTSPAPGNDRKKVPNKNAFKTARKTNKIQARPDVGPMKPKRTYTRRKVKNPFSFPSTSNVRGNILSKRPGRPNILTRRADIPSPRLNKNYSAQLSDDIENFTIITSDDELQPDGASADAATAIRVYSDCTTSFRGNISFKLTKKTIVGRGIPVNAKVAVTMTNAIMSRAKDTWDSIKSGSRVLKRSADRTNELESHISIVDIPSLNVENSSVVDTGQVVYMQLPVGTVLCLNDGRIQAIDPATNLEIKLSDEERDVLTAAYSSTNTYTQDGNLDNSIICVPDDPKADSTGKLADTLPETVVLVDDDDDDDSPKILENERDFETMSPHRHTPCSTSRDVETVNIESSETAGAPTDTNTAVVNQTTRDPPKKSILSDLMEISGISSEDATSYNESTDEVSQALGESKKNQATTKILTPLTSTPNGEIATDEHGQYFLIHSETGDITPLTVASSPGKMTQSTQQSKTSPTNIIQSEKHVSRIPFILQRRRVLEEKALLCNPLRRNRKQILKKKKEKLEAKIDLVDSDAPVCEEYLIESDSEQGTLSTVLKGDLYNPEMKVKFSKRLKKKRKQTVVVESDSCDSSDEEPLSNIAAKKSKSASDNFKKPQTEIPVRGKQSIQHIPKLNQCQSESANSSTANISEKLSEKNENTNIQENLPLETEFDQNSTIEQSNTHESNENDLNMEAVAETSLDDGRDGSPDQEEDPILGI